jgi:hypothetical protein
MTGDLLLGRSAALRASYRVFDSVYLSEDALKGPRSFGENATRSEDR